MECSNFYNNTPKWAKRKEMLCGPPMYGMCTEADCLTMCSEIDKEGCCQYLPENATAGSCAFVAGDPLLVTREGSKWQAALCAKGGRMCGAKPAAICSADPTVLCYWDVGCSTADQPGCNAAGIHQNCRFCSVSDNSAGYPACPDPDNGQKPTGCTEEPAAVCGGTSERCYWDPTCSDAVTRLNGLGCNAGG